MSPLVPALMCAVLTFSSPLPDGHADTRGSGVWPLSPRPEVVRGFDAPDSPWGAGHRGVDLAGSPGQVVRSALSGQVMFAGRLAGRGVVVVTHGPTRTTYEPVRATVRVGDPVSAGTPVGVLEPAQSHCAPASCLHWGWLRGEVYLDPLGLVGAGPVRLLPLSGLPAPGPPRPPALTSPTLPARGGSPLELAGMSVVTGLAVGAP